MQFDINSCMRYAVQGKYLYKAKLIVIYLSKYSKCNYFPKMPENLCDYNALQLALGRVIAMTTPVFFLLFFLSITLLAPAVFVPMALLFNVPSEVRVIRGVTSQAKRGRYPGPKGC